MAVLNRDDFLSRISTVIGDDTSDESLAFIEDMTETFDHMAEDSAGDGVDWKSKYEENDAAWKKRYKNAFFGGKRPNYSGNSGHDDDDDDNYNEEDVTIDDLFTSK